MTKNDGWLNLAHCSMKSCKSESWILRVGLLANQYPHKSQCSVELDIVLFPFALPYIPFGIAAVDFLPVIAGLAIHNILKDSVCRNEQKVLWLPLHGNTSLCLSSMEKASQ